MQLGNSGGLRTVFAHGFLCDLLCISQAQSLVDGYLRSLSAFSPPPRDASSAIRRPPSTFPTLIPPSAKSTNSTTRPPILFSLPRRPYAATASSSRSKPTTRL